ncbi:MAG TPA: phage holin family protein [Streptosporangiaceae bacterium]|nr:phage holin family protein [Streptosporangiaceae bacterium]
MAEPAGRYSAGAASQESVGGLVSLAVKDITQLVRYELDLAKMELKTDVRRVGIGAALFGLSAFVGCLVLMLLCFALAYGLMALGIWGWAAFLITAGACVLVAALAVGIGILSVKKFGGLPKTRRTVSDDIAILRRGDGAGAPPRTPVR